MRSLRGADSTQGKHNCKCRTLAHLAFNSNRPTVGFDDPVHNCQAESAIASFSTHTGRIDAVETVKDMGQMFWRDANTGITNNQIGLSVLAMNPYAHVPS